jgi:serine/threonine protein kinase
LTLSLNKQRGPVATSTLGRVCPTCKTEYPPGVLRCPKDNASTLENAISVGSHPLTGTFIGSYRIKKLIGAGGMGEVLLGEHPTLGMSVAIKILRKEVSQDAELVSRFFAEAKTIANLKHPNIVEVVDLSVLPDGRAYYMMEHLQGQSLAKAISRAQYLSPQDALPLFRELLSALAVAHQKGVIHRDIKPANIFLLKELQNGARVKLLDFGIAKLLTPTKGTALSLPGIVLGTPAYMSPEQAMGKPVGATSDLYSVGVVLFEALTGDLPFGDLDDQAVMSAHVRRAYPKLSSRRPELAHLDALLGRFLEKDPTNRFASANEAITALEAAEKAPPQREDESEEALTLRRSPTLEETTLEMEKTVRNHAKNPKPNKAKQQTARAPEHPIPILKQENLEVAPELLLPQQEAPTFEPTMRLRPKAATPHSSDPLADVKAAAPPKNGAPLIMFGVIGLLLLAGLLWFFFVAP